MFDYEKNLETIIHWLMTSGLRIAIIVLIAFVAYFILRFFAEKSIKFVSPNKAERELEKQANTLYTLLKTVIKIALSLIVGAMILEEFGIKIGPLLAAAGVVGIAIGFGSQRLVEDIISGFFILMENQVRIGDYIQTAGMSGEVEKVGLRSIILRDFSGNVHFIRNGKIDFITNMTKDYSRYLFKIGVAYKENVDEVARLMREVDNELRADADFKDDILEPLEVMGLDQFADSALIIKARTKTRPQQQWRVAREFNRRLKISFDKNNIEIPFPHVTLYMGQEKDGSAAPLYVKSESGDSSPE